MSRRCRWSESERRALLAAHAESGLSAAEFARVAEVPYTTLVSWTRRPAGSAGASRLVPVEVLPAAGSGVAGSAVVEVVVGAATIRVPADFDESLLARLVRTLRAC